MYRLHDSPAQASSVEQLSACDAVPTICCSPRTPPPQDLALYPPPLQLAAVHQHPRRQLATPDGPLCRARAPPLGRRRLTGARGNGRACSQRHAGSGGHKAQGATRNKKVHCPTSHSRVGRGGQHTGAGRTPQGAVASPWAAAAFVQAHRPQAESALQLATPQPKQRPGSSCHPLAARADAQSARSSQTSPPLSY